MLKIMSKEIKKLIEWYFRKSVFTFHILLVLAIIFILIVFPLNIVSQAENILKQYEGMNLLEGLQEYVLTGFFSGIENLVAYLIPLFAALSFGSEIETNEIEITLTYPVNRKEVYVAKIVVDLFILISALLLSILILDIIIYVKFGIFLADTFAIRLFFVGAITSFLIYFLSVLIAVSFASLFSTLITTDIILWLWSRLTAGLLFHDAKTLNLATSLTWQGFVYLDKLLKYILHKRNIPSIFNLNPSDFWVLWAYNYLIVFIVCATACLILSYLIFTKRDL